ncbi:MAG: glutaminase, partial [Eudoraea sp.]|nr:glutaminase [Eudoraea sp.]
MIDFQAIIEGISNNLQSVEDRGDVATYIPELAKADKNKFGIHLIDSSNNNFSSGDSEEAFSIQSISKVLSLAQAFGKVGDQLWERVGVEPSGDPFNHLSLLEMENGIPRNPLINAGALVVCDVLISHFDNPKDDFLSYVRRISNEPEIYYDEKVAQSEKRSGFNNYAAAYLLKSYGNLKN